MQRDAPSEGVERREMVRSMLTATLWAAAASVALSMLLGSFGAGYYVGYAEAWRDAVGRNALTLTSNRIDR